MERQEIGTMPWSVTPEKLREAIRRIVEAGKPRRIILFGSAARGQSGPDSDVDLLVVTGDEVTSCRRESVRLRRAVGDVLLALDIVVVPESRLAALGQVPGLVYRVALREGRVLYEAPRAA